MHEASKTLKHFTPDELRLLEGEGIDIGCGLDPILPNARRFDLDEGDANRIGDFVHDQFEFVFSSHCLEHMRDVDAALLQWWGLVKPGGHLVFVVPDEDLYEQGHFPSWFNDDHQATFTLAKEKSWSPVSRNVLDLALALPGSTLVSLRLQDDGYARGLAKFGPLRYLRVIRNVLTLPPELKRRRGLGSPVKALRSLLFDQTLGPALAQILCIVRKG